MIDLDLIKNFSINKSDWIKVKFGDIAYEPKESVKDPVAEGIEHVVGLEHIDSEDIHLRRSATIEEGTTFTKRFRKGDVLFGRRRAYLKKAAKADFDGICSGDITVMRANQDLLLPELLPFIVNNDKFFDYAIEHSAGGLSPRVKFKDLASFEVLLPTKEQQTELIELLCASDTLVENKIKVESLLHNLLRSSEADFFISNKHNEVKLGLLVQKLLSGGTPNTKNLDFYKNGNTPWLTTKLLVSDYVSKGEKLITDEAIASSATKVLPKGNILAGTRVGVGKFSINEVDMAFSQDVTGLIIDKSKVDINFLLHQLNSFVIQHKITPFLQGTTIKGITKDNLLNLKVYLPDHEKQHNISKRISDIKEAISKLESQKKAAITLNNSLINQVF